ncbi:MAG TPA: oligosaccharide flippase family protein [Candidatus Brocadiia bacterium]|nr:oligosaccharide flippase family protein [Candidatus Brocadiia bacterium]
MGKGDSALRGTILTVGANFIIRFATIITGVLTARILGPSGKGALSAVMLWPMIIAGLGTLGCHWVLARRAAERPESYPDVSRLGVFSTLGLAVFVLPVGYFILPSLLPPDKQDLVWYSRLMLMFIPFNFIITCLQSMDQGMGRFARYNAMTTSVTLINMALLVIIWFVDIGTVFYFVIAMLITNLAVGAARIGVSLGSLMAGRPVRIRDGVTLIREGLPFLPTTVGLYCDRKLDTVVAVTLLSSRQVGLYDAAFTFALAPMFIPSALAVVAFSAIARRKDRAETGRAFAAAFRQSGILCAVLMLGTAALVPVAVPFLFGNRFTGAVTPCFIMVLIFPLRSLGRLQDEALRAIGEPIPGFIALAVAMCANLALGIPLALKFELIGLASSVMLAEFIRCGILTYYVKNRFSLATSDLWKWRVQDIRSLLDRMMSLLPPRLRRPLLSVFPYMPGFVRYFVP